MKGVLYDIDDECKWEWGKVDTQKGMIGGRSPPCLKYVCVSIGFRSKLFDPNLISDKGKPVLALTAHLSSRQKAGTGLFRPIRHHELALWHFCSQPVQRQHLRSDY